jgi:hypothetical protein
MEAVANGQQAYQFSSEPHTCEIYAFRGLGFESAEIPPQFGQTIPTNYYIVIQTKVYRHLEHTTQCMFVRQKYYSTMSQLTSTTRETNIATCY